MMIWIIGGILLIAVIIVTTLMILSIKNKVDDVSNKLPDLDNGLNDQEEVEVMQDIIDKNTDILIEGIDEKAIKEQLKSKDSDISSVKNGKTKLPSLTPTEDFTDMCDSLNQDELKKEGEY